MNTLALCSAWRNRRDNDIGTVGEKRRKLEVVQLGGVSVWNRIHVPHLIVDYGTEEILVRETDGGGEDLISFKFFGSIIILLLA